MGGMAATRALMAGNQAEKDGVTLCPFIHPLLIKKWKEGFGISVKGREERMVREQTEAAAAPKYWWMEW